SSSSFESTALSGRSCSSNSINSASRSSGPSAAKIAASTIFLICCGSTSRFLGPVVGGFVVIDFQGRQGLSLLQHQGFRLDVDRTERFGLDQFDQRAFHQFQNCQKTDYHAQ